MNLFSVVFLVWVASAQDVQYLPTVMWHGMGDSCCNPLSLGRIKRIIEKELPGIYVYSIQTGKNFLADTVSGYLGNVNEQIDEVCQTLKNDPLLQGGYNGLGFSQGSQFLRGLVQRCTEIPVHNMVSLGGQHQGIFGLPTCPKDPSSSRVCEFVRRLLNFGAYETSVQSRIVQAQYWHDPLKEDWYRNASIFLAEINNENEVNDDYKRRLQSLANFVMVKFSEDSEVVPRESSWFGFYASEQDKDVLPLQNTSLYTEDRLGLKQLNEEGKLQFLISEGDHLQFTNEWFIENIVNVYLNTEV